MSRLRAQFRGKTPEPVIHTRITETGDTVPAIGVFTATEGTIQTKNVSPAGEEVLPANPGRAGFLITNQGVPGGASDPVYWGFNSSVMVPTAVEGPNRGQELVATAYISSLELPGYTGPIFMIADAGQASQVSVVEWNNA